MERNYRHSSLSMSCDVNWRFVLWIRLQWSRWRLTLNDSLWAVRRSANLRRSRFWKRCLNRRLNRSQQSRYLWFDAPHLCMMGSLHSMC